MRDRNGRVTGVATSARDETALWRAETRLIDAQRAASIGFWEWDLATGRFDGSERMAEMFSLPIAPGGSPNAPFLERVHPDDNAALRENSRAALAGRRPYDLDFRIVLPDGAERWIHAQAEALRDSDGIARGLAGTAMDITARKQSEVALERALRRLRALRELDHAVLAHADPEAIARATLEYLQVLLPRLFRASVSEFDCERAEAIVLATLPARDGSVTAGDRFPVDGFDLEAFLRDHRPYVARHGESNWRDSPIHRRILAGGVRAVATAPLVNQGRLIGFLSLEATDPETIDAEAIEILQEAAIPLALAIEQARLDQAVARHTHELEARVAERTSELESFVHSVSHDLRAPLRAMSGFADALLEDFGKSLGAAGCQYASRIGQAAGQMDALIADLFTYSRLDRVPIALERESLGHAVRETVDQLQAEINGTGAALRIEGPLPDVLAHRSTLVQVLGNLVSNALKFAPSGAKPQVRIRTERDAQWVRLWVEDAGIGIAPEHQERIFGVFERLHGAESYPGTGMGLAIVKKGAQRMGGDVGLESGLGKGSRFWVRMRGA